MSAVPETPPEATPEPAAPAPVERPCTTCGAALADGQDWCLECGSAQPGRLGGRPGWRAALTVMGVTALLAVGAGAAAYAALESESTREATAQAPPSATPTQQTPPTATAETAPPTTPTTPPTTDTTPETVDPPGSAPADVPEPTPAPTPAPTPPPSPAPTPAPAPTPSPAPTPAPTDTGATKPEPVAIELKDDFMSVYDPYKREASQAPTDPGKAVDGKNDTAWSVNVGPDGEVRMGLVISLEKAQKLGDLELRADTPGFTVETYATKSSELPPDVLDARWKHLDDARDVGVRETLKLDGTYRHVLLWVTSQPADTKVAIPEIELFQQED